MDNNTQAPKTWTVKLAPCPNTGRDTAHNVETLDDGREKWVCRLCCEVTVR